QDDVAVGVAAGDDGGGLALDVDAEESLGLRGGLDGVDGDGESAVGAVFEAERHGQAGGHLPVGLRFGGAGADRRPADEVGDVLRRDRIEQLGGGGQAEIENLAQERAGEAQAAGDVVRAVEMRVHDQALPADGGAGFFKIDAHDDHDAVGDFGGEGGEAAGVVEAGLGAVDRAGADHEQETFVVGEDDPVDVPAAAGDEVALRGAFGQLGQQLGRSGQGAGLNDIDVRSLLHEGSNLARSRPAGQACEWRGDAGAKKPSRVGDGWRIRGKSWPATYP